MNDSSLYRSAAAALVALSGMVGAAAPALAADSGGSGQPAASTPSIWERSTLTGDWGGTRTALSDHGVDLSLNYIGETLGVLSGGLSREQSYEGRVELSVDADLQKLMNWEGGKAHFTIYNINNGGRNAAQNVGSIADPSNIDAYRTTRLFTAWLEQSLFNDRFSIRLGQLAADDEFLTSDTAGGLINGTFGWAGLMAANMTNGGPAYPLATPGVRLKFQANDQVSALVGVFNGDPAGKDCDDDPQKCNRHGTKFPLDGGTLLMGELQYRANQAKDATGLPGTYKLGAWYSDNKFADQRYGLDAAGATVSLADPSLDSAKNHRGDWGLYGVADQMIWRGHDSSVNAFVRGGFSPSNRNLISYYVDGGLGWKGPFAGRPDDTLTFGVAYAKISDDAVNADRDALAISGPPYAVRSSETVLELNYTAHITPWWTIQPDLQYIMHPNGGQNPDDPTQGLNHAFVVGLRTTIAF
ncbi:carbohydrate porin [Candidimonas nitroreducens]|uniref:Carbohydrate porin n=1 Tax=Candidimonas nitroreducens TaxID=683354 RepID=A0A225MYL1_9BURK|nr:carbohydrate porin [Candidimonas nitroreducens]OWT66348.1 carbohydrate porin [Candidimonas nitroreducens]